MAGRIREDGKKVRGPSKKTLERLAAASNPLPNASESSSELQKSSNQVPLPPEPPKAVETLSMESDSPATPSDQPSIPAVVVDDLQIDDQPPRRKPKLDASPVPITTVVDKPAATRKNPPQRPSVPKRAASQPKPPTVTRKASWRLGARGC